MSSENHSSYVLWLPSWYPCKLTPYDGDFIQRHAQAVSGFASVHVFHLVRDKEGAITKDIKIEENQTGKLKETIIYYYSNPFPFQFLDSFISLRKFNRIYKKYLTDYFLKQGLPSLVHVHIAFKAGLIARWIKKNMNIPFLLTEQWTVYLEEAKPKIKDLALSNQILISKIITDAALVLPVSNYLAKSIQRRWKGVECEVVPNVVDTNLFFPGAYTSDEKLRLIHISTLTYQKDPESLLEAMGILKKKGIYFSLDIVGPIFEKISSLVKENNVDSEVLLKGEMPQSDLAGMIRNSDILILYSRYETFGCVIIEANACGVPVIVPDTQLMNELVKKNQNGILVHPGSAMALAEALIDFSKTKTNYSRKNIAIETSEKYSYSRVGVKYAEIYSRYITG